VLPRKLQWRCTLALHGHKSSTKVTGGKMDGPAPKQSKNDLQQESDVTTAAHNEEWYNQKRSKANAVLVRHANHKCAN